MLSEETADAAYKSSDEIIEYAVKHCCNVQRRVCWHYPQDTGMGIADAPRKIAFEGVSVHPFRELLHWLLINSRRRYTFVAMQQTDHQHGRE